MNVGKEFEFKGIPLRAEREMSDLSCDGCFFKYISTKNQIGCLTTSEEKVFDCCKHDHIIFICLDSETRRTLYREKKNDGTYEKGESV